MRANWEGVKIINEKENNVKCKPRKYTRYILVEVNILTPKIIGAQNCYYYCRIAEIFFWKKVFAPPKSAAGELFVKKIVYF